MPTFYTVLFVAVLFAVAIPVGRRLYPNGSGRAFPAWVQSLPNAALGLVGVIGIAFGVVAAWVSGQVLFGASDWTIESWLPVIGILAGVLIAIYGISFFGVIVLKKKPGQTN